MICQTVRNGQDFPNFNKTILPLFFSTVSIARTSEPSRHAGQSRCHTGNATCLLQHGNFCSLCKQNMLQHYHLVPAPAQISSELATKGPRKSMLKVSPTPLAFQGPVLQVYQMLSGTASQLAL